MPARRTTAARIAEKYTDEVVICSADSLADDLMHAVEAVTVMSLKYLPDYLASLRSVVAGLATMNREQWAVAMDAARAANDGEAGYALAPLQFL